MKALVLALALLPAAARAAVGCYGSDHPDCAWGAADWAVEGTALSLIAVDWGQTRWARMHGFEESNPLLGRRPSIARVNLMIGGTMLAHAAIAGLLPRPWRWLWGAVAISVEAPTVYNNVAIGGAFQVSLP